MLGTRCHANNCVVIRCDADNCVATGLQRTFAARPYIYYIIFKTSPPDLDEHLFQYQIFPGGILEVSMAIIWTDCGQYGLGMHFGSLDVDKFISG